MVFSIKQRDRWIFPFKPLGKTSPRDQHTMDAVEAISHFSKAELTLLSVVNTHIQPDNQVVIRRSDFSDKKKRQLTAAIKSWQNKNLLIRTKREHYLVNPYFFTPALKKQAQVKENWVAKS